MARPLDNDDDEKPLDPAVEKVRRKLVRFVAINLGILLFALMAVGIAIVYKSRTPGPQPIAGSDVVSDIPVPPDQPLAGDIVLPVGSKVVSQSLSGNRVSLDVELADGGRAIFLYDIAARRIIGRFAIRNQ